MSDVELKIKVDGSESINIFQQILGQLKEIKDANNSLSKAANDSSTQRIAAEKQVISVLVEGVKATDSLKRKLEDQGRSGVAAFKTDPIKAYNAALKESGNIIKDLSSNAAKNILNPQEIKQLTAALKGTTNEFEALSAILDVTKAKLSGLDTASPEFKELTSSIQAAEAMLAAFNAETALAEPKQANLRTRLREVTLELAQLKEQGRTNTEQYRLLKEEAGELFDTLADAKEEIRQAGSDTKGFDKLIRTASLVTSGFQIAQGAAALFGDENEEIQKTLLRVNAAMSILNGLQAIQGELARADTLVKAVQIGFQNAYTWAITGSTVALRAFKIALIATGIGAFVVLLGFALEAMGAFGDETDDTAEKEKKLADQLERTRKLMLETVDATETLRNARAGRLNDDKRELELAEARGDKEMEIAKLKKEVLNEELRNLDIAFQSFEGDAEKRLEYQEKIKDKKTQIAAIDLALEKKLAEERKKNHDQRLSDLEELAKFLKGEETSRVAAIKDNNARELAEISHGRQQELDTLKDAYNKLIKRDTLTADARTHLKESYGRQQQLITEKYANKELETLTKQNKEILDIQLKAQAALLQLRANREDIEIAQVNKEYDDIRASIIAAGKLTEEAEVAITKARYKAIGDVRGKYAIEELNQREELAKAGIDLLRVQGASEETLTRLKEKAKQRIEEEFAKERLNRTLKQKGLNERLTEDDVQAYQKYLAEAAKKGSQPASILEFLNVDLSGLTDDERAALEKLGISLSAAIGKGMEGGFKPYTIEGLLKETFNLTDKEYSALAALGDDLASSLSDTFSSITAMMEDEIEKQIDLIDEKIDKYDEMIDEIEKAYDREVDAAAKGYANTVDIERARLLEVTALRDMEVQKKKEQEAELERIRVIQAKANAAALIADRLATSTSLVLTVANIFEGFSKIPLGVGIALGAVVVAGFIASFAKASADIRKASAPTFRDGGLFNVLDGQPSHEQGGVGVYSGNRKIAELEGNEKLFVVNKGSGRKYAPLLEAINNDELSSWSYYDLMRHISPSPIRFDDSAPRQILRESREAKAASAQPQAEGGLLHQIAAYTQHLPDIAESNEAMRSQGIMIGNDLHIKTRTGTTIIRNKIKQDKKRK